MPAFAERTVHGTTPQNITGLLADETDLTMQTVNRTSTATKTTFENNNGSTHGVLYTNHILTIAITADLLTLATATSLPNLYHGDDIPGASLNNWPAAQSWFGHDNPGDNTTLGEIHLEDPTIEATVDATEAPSFTANLVSHPWIAIH